MLVLHLMRGHHFDVGMRVKNGILIGIHPACSISLSQCGCRIQRVLFYTDKAGVPGPSGICSRFPIKWLQAQRPGLDACCRKGWTCALWGAPCFMAASSFHCCCVVTSSLGFDLGVLAKGWHWPPGVFTGVFIGVERQMDDIPESVLFPK